MFSDCSWKTPHTTDIVGKGTMSKMGFVPFKHGLIIKSRENASLQNDLRADNKWNVSSEKGKVTSLEGRKEEFRRVFQKAVEFGLGFKRCVAECGSA